MNRCLTPKPYKAALNRLYWRYETTRRVLAAIFAIFLAFSTPVAALTEAQLDMYNRNGIYYYNPDGNECGTSYKGDVNVYGGTMAEKIWTGLTSFLTDEQAAGVMGNMQNESGLNPLAHEHSQVAKYQPGFDLLHNTEAAYGIGLVQWSFGRRTAFLQYIQSKDAGLLKYFEDYQAYGMTYNANDLLDKIDDSTLNTIVALSIDFIKDEIQNNYQGLLRTTTVEEASTYFLTNYERPANPNPSKRAADAQKFYDQFHGKTISGGSSGGGSSGSTSSSSNSSSKGTLLSNHSTITFYSSAGSENGGNAGHNATESINNGNLALGQAAVKVGDPDLTFGDVIYVETTSNQSEEGAYVNGKYFIIADTGAGDGGVSGNNNIDIFHDPASENGSAPFGMSKNAKIYKVASNVSWQDYLSKYSNGNASTDSTGASVTVIGDSIAVMSEPDLKKLLPDVQTNNVGGRAWAAALTWLKNNSTRDQIVFAHGSNNTAPALTQKDIDDLLAATQGKNIYFITNYTTNSYQDTYNTNNQLFKEAADKHNNVYVIDWMAAASENPEKYLTPDGLHPSSEGQKLWAELVANAVKGNSVESDICGVTASGDVGSLQQNVLKYAWPEYHSAPYVTPKPDYANLVQERIANNKYVGGIRYRGIDCGGWVTSIVQVSGWEPNYNDGQGATDGQEAWVKEHGWTLLNGDANTEIDTSKLQAGDVAFSSGHTFIYVGEIPGFDSNIASASLDERAPMAGAESLTYGNGVTVRWYRKGV